MGYKRVDPSIPWDDNNEGRVSEQPWMLTDLAMQASILWGKAAAVEPLEQTFSGKTPAENGELAVKQPMFPPWTIGTAGEYNE